MIYLKVEAKDPAKTIHVKSDFTAADPLNPATRSAVLELLGDAMNTMAEDER